MTRHYQLQKGETVWLNPTAPTAQYEAERLHGKRGTYQGGTGRAPYEYATVLFEGDDCPRVVWLDSIERARLVSYRCPECGANWGAWDYEEDGQICPGDDCGATGRDEFLDEGL